MRRRHSLAALFCLGLFSVAAGGQEPPALAVKAKAILKAACYRCHGEAGAVEGGFNFVLDHAQLIERRRILPGQPAKSKLIKRIANGEMPPEEEKPRVSDKDLNVLKEWIAAGAPDFDPPPPKREHITPANIIDKIADDLAKLPERDQRFTRYFTITHLYNAGLSEDELQTYRHALTKLVNSLSWGKNIVLPAPIDPAKTVFRIDLREYKWTEKTWDMMLGHYPYGWLLGTATERRCQTATQSRMPHLRADWFVATAAHPPLYHDILQIPLTDVALEKELRVDVAENLKGERVLRAGFNSSGVSRNNRLIERHETAFGAYWKSYDFGGNAGKQNLFALPLGPAPLQGGNAFQHDGGESIFNLPNGLQAYQLVDARGRRIDKGPTEIVSDPRRPDRAVVNGLSCMSCHARGIIPKDDQIRAHVEKNRKAFGKREFDNILALYPPRDKLAALMEEDAERFRAAVEKTGQKLGATEPIVALALRFEAELDLKLAAAEMGLTPAALVSDLDKSPALTRILGPLRVDGGTVQRQVFTDSFPSVIRDLRLGTFVARAAPATRSWSPSSSLLPPVWKKAPSFRSPPPIVIRNPKIDLSPSTIVSRDHRSFEFRNVKLTKIEAVAFSPTDRLIASEISLGRVSLWDPASGDAVATLAGDAASITSLCFSPDGKTLAVGSLKATHLWDVPSRKEIRTLPGHISWVHSVRFSPDGKSVATACEKIRMWDTATGQERVQFPLIKEFINGLAFSPDGKILASGSKSVRLWDADTGRELVSLTDHRGPILTVAFSADGKLLASGSSDKTVILWDVASRKRLAVLQGHRDPLSSVAFTPDGRLLVSTAGGIRFNPGNLGEVKLWDVANRRELASLSGHTKGVSCVAISSDGRQAASSGWDRTIRLWDLPAARDWPAIDKR
jgi:WD40 repeat protein/mono/diheme cytochrome c family protein